MKAQMIAGRIARSLRARSALLAALGCIAVMLSPVQSHVAYGAGYTVMANGSYSTDSENPYDSLTLGTGTNAGTMYMFCTGEQGPDNEMIASIGTAGSACQPLVPVLWGNGGGNALGNLIYSGGTLYGMEGVGSAALGTANGNGNIFSVALSTSAVTTLATFTGTSGAYPGANTGSSMLLNNGALYGMTYQGGSANDGVIFSFNLSTSTEQSLALSGTMGYNPTGDLLLSGSTMYGMMPSGGAHSDGVIFSVGTNLSNYQVLYSFTGGTDGKSPGGSLILSGSTVYGMTNSGSTASGTKYGTVFSFNLSSSTLTTLAAFNSSNGANPTTNSLLLNNGVLFGMTPTGGADSQGVIFSISDTGGSITDVHNFAGGSGDGSQPQGSLILVGTTMYGVTEFGGADSSGVVFALPTPALSTTTAYTSQAATAHATTSWASSGTFGTAVTQAVTAGANYATLASYVNGVSGGGSPPILSTTATIQAGINSTASSTTVSMAWRTRATNEGTAGTVMSFAYDETPGDEVHAGVGGVPEPGTLALLAAGGAACAAFLIKRRKQAA